MNETSKTKLKRIIGTNTLFEFKCGICKLEGTSTGENILKLNEEVKQYMDINIKLQEKLDNERETVREQNEKMEQLGKKQSWKMNNELKSSQKKHTTQMKLMKGNTQVDKSQIKTKRNWKQQYRK